MAYRITFKTEGVGPRTIIIATARAAWQTVDALMPLVLKIDIEGDEGPVDWKELRRRAQGAYDA